MVPTSADLRVIRWRLQHPSQKEDEHGAKGILRSVVAPCVDDVINWSNNILARRWKERHHSQGQLSSTIGTLSEADEQALASLSHFGGQNRSDRDARVSS